MLNANDILQTIKMIDEEDLDIRTITMGISLLDCADADIDKSCEKIYNKITRLAKDLVKTGNDIEKEYGIPVINKRISVTPIAMLAAVSGGDPIKYALTLERCAQSVPSWLFFVMHLKIIRLWRVLFMVSGKLTV